MQGLVAKPATFYITLEAFMEFSSFILCELMCLLTTLAGQGHRACFNLVELVVGIVEGKVNAYDHFLVDVLLALGAFTNIKSKVSHMVLANLGAVKLQQFILLLESFAGCIATLCSIAVVLYWFLYHFR